MDRGDRPGRADPRAYIRLAAEIRAQIADGRLAAGAPLQPIGVLCREHGVSRGTGSHAMRLLEEEGLIFRVPGHGYYVR